MKKTAYATAALSVMVLIVGLLFLVYNVVYSNYILVLSLFLMAASLIIFYSLDKRYMYIMGSIFCFLPMVGLMFRQLSLPGAELLISIGLFLFGLVFVPWYAYKCYKA